MSKEIILAPSSPLKRIVSEDASGNDNLTPTKKQKSSDTETGSMQSVSLHFDTIPGLGGNAQEDENSQSGSARSLTDIDDVDNIFGVDDENYSDPDEFIREMWRSTNAENDTSTYTKTGNITVKNNRQPISKKDIETFIEVISSTELSRHVLVNISGNEFTMVGRPPVTGSSKKQMRHITPYSFLKHNIENTILNNITYPKTILHKLKYLIIALIHNHKGYAIWEQDLVKDSYQDVKQQIDTMISNKQHCVKRIQFPTKQSLYFVDDTIDLFNTPTRQSKALEDFKKHYIKFVQYGINCAVTRLENHPNDLNILSEVLTRMILIIFNLQPYVALADEGNTQNFQIRLYNDSNNCKKATDEYMLITAKELEARINNNTISTKQTHIRIVDNEGYMVKLYNEALNQLSHILNIQHNKLDDKIQEYNKKYTPKLLLQFSNVSCDLREFNQPIKITNNDDTNHIHIIKHIAKIFYLAFDLKALEDKVLVLYNKLHNNTDNYTLYNGATKDAKECYFKIANGNQYRKEQVQNAKGYNKDAIFYNTIDNLTDILPQIIARHCMLSTFAFENFDIEDETDNEYISKDFRDIVVTFTHLLALDHQLEQHENKIANNTLSIITEIYKSQLEEESSLTISILGCKHSCSKFTNFDVGQSFCTATNVEDNMIEHL